jgi:hypothetical protein
MTMRKRWKNLKYTYESFNKSDSFIDPIGANEYQWRWMREEYWGLEKRRLKLIICYFFQDLFGLSYLMFWYDLLNRFGDMISRLVKVMSGWWDEKHGRKGLLNICREVDVRCVSYDIKLLDNS